MAKAEAPRYVLDLGEHFARRSATGPWLRWTRNESCAWLRIDRVVEVVSWPIRALTPLPVWVQAGPFWAVGVRNDEIFLLMDPARLRP